MCYKQFIYLSVLISLIYLGTGKTLGQERNTDSLLIELINVESDTSKIDILNKIAQTFQLTNTDSGIFYIKKSIVLAQNNNFSGRLAVAHSIYGSILKNMGSYTLSLKEHQKALKLFEKQNDQLGIARTYNNIAIVHIFQENQLIGLDYFFSALKIAKKINDEYLLKRTLNNIGYVYQTQNEYTKAIEYFEKVVEIDSTIRNLRLLGHTYINLGRSYLKLNKIEKALWYHNKSLDANIKIKSELGKTFSYLALADLYFELAQKSVDSGIKRKNLIKAIYHATSAYEIALINGYNNHLKDATHMLYLSNKGIGNHNKALDFLELHLVYKDSLYNSTKMKEIESLEAQFQSEKNTLQIENLEKENQLNSKNLKILQTRQFFLVLMSAFFLVFIFILLSIRKKLRNRNTTIFKQNDTINAQYEEISQQNDALQKHRDHLEEMIREQTKDLVDAKERAEHADKLKTSFLENLSHEIRTPLNAIVGFSDLMEFEEGLSDKSKNFLHHINSSSDSLLGIIDSIMQVSNMQTGVFKLSISLFNLPNLILELKNEFINTEVFIKKQQLEFRLKIDIEPNTIINSDIESLKIILFNLTDNALKFTEKGRIEIGVSKKGESHFEFYVSDTGIGIVQEDIKFIFDKFRKVEPNKSKLYRGLGLGLTIAQSLIEQLGGEIWLESEAGKGSTFYFTITL